MTRRCVSACDGTAKHLVLALLAIAHPLSCAEGAATDPAVISVDDLVRIAVAHAPRLSAATAAVDAASAGVRQASVFPNPTGSAEVGRARPRDGSADLTTWRAAVEQRLDLGRKRSSRIEAAESARDAARASSSGERFEIEIAVRRAAGRLIAAQAVARRAAESSTLADDLTALMSRRAEAGEGTRSDALRAQVEAKLARSVMTQRATEAEIATASIRSLVGDRVADRFTVAGVASETTVDRAALERAIDRHPRLAILQAVLAQRRAEAARERSASRPDVSVGVFGGRSADADEAGLSLALDLPVWDRNAAGVAVAEAEVRRATAEVAAERARIERDCASALAADEEASSRARTLVNEVRPLAYEVLDARMKALAAGEVDLEAALDARRSFQSVEDAISAASADAITARIDLIEAAGTAAIVPSTGDPR